MSLRKTKLSELKKVLITLEAREFVYLVGGFLKLNTQEQLADVSLPDQLKLMLADWMAHLGFVTDRQRVQVLRRVSLWIERWSGRLAVALADEKYDLNVPAKSKLLTNMTVTISDSRWVCTNHDETWLDLITDEEVESLPERAGTHVTADVLGLYAKMRKRLDALGGKDDTRADKHDRGVQVPPG